MTLRILLISLLILVIDLYVFQAFRLVFRNSTVNLQKIVTFSYWTITALSLIIIFAAAFTDIHTWPKPFRTYSFSVIFIITFSKLFVIVFLLTDDVLRVLRWAFEKIFVHPATASAGDAEKVSNGITRSDFLIKTGLIIGSIPFFSMLYGMVKWAYDFRIHKVKLNLPDLPVAFDGFKIIHISDIHTGSFMSPEPLSDAIKLVMDQQADLILFTGDLVNNRYDELPMHKHSLRRLKARYGVFSVLGNHDYGDYVKWDSPEEKEKNMADLLKFQRDLGWDVLMDEHRVIAKDGQYLTVIGVQNWSTHLRFPKYGSMEKATENIRYSPVNFLLTHDPSHWEGEILKKYPEIDVTFSGHTHGMQFGIEIPGFKWSPVQYIYKQWAGLYRKGKQYIYVNRGLGFLGYPGRVGILPEITLFEIHRK